MENLSEIIRGMNMTFAERRAENAQREVEPAVGLPAGPAGSPAESFAVTFPVSVGLLEGKHVAAIGDSLWCFLWCINRVTFDRQDPETGEFWGQVLGGHPFLHERIADELSLTPAAVLEQLHQLEEGGYLRINRGRSGLVTEVARSIKWQHRPGKRRFATAPHGRPPAAVPAAPRDAAPQENGAVQEPAPAPAATQLSAPLSLSDALRERQRLREDAGAVRPAATAGAAGAAGGRALS